MNLDDLGPLSEPEAQTLRTVLCIMREYRDVHTQIELDDRPVAYRMGYATDYAHVGRRITITGSGAREETHTR